MKIRITAPAHLHAGNMDLNGSMGRLYGTVGFAVENPRVVIEIEKSESVEANDPVAERFAKTVANSFGFGGFRVTVKERFPEYTGLGYVTTLGISVGIGAARLHGINCSAEEIALKIRRGLVTALGLYACKLGGFIVEGGFRKGMVERSVPPLIFRGEIPENWIFVIAVPEAPRRRIAELRIRSEERILLQEVSMNAEDASYLSRLVLMKMIPSFVERDLAAFGEAITEFNRRLGFIWERYQKGLYCDPLVERGIEIMLEHAYGACQSSWGPAFYAITDSEDKARRLADKIRDFLSFHGGGDVFVTRGNNRGLEVVELG
jgi:beta-ribofuranosylaminobenzene 5'-phosphate synthase